MQKKNMIRTISFFSFFLLAFSCQKKTDHFKLIETRKETNNKYDYSLQIEYLNDTIGINWIVKDSTFESINLLKLNKAKDYFVLAESNFSKGFYKNFIGKKILTHDDFYVSYIDTFEVLDEVNNVSLYNYQLTKGNYVAVISQYYRPQYKIRIFYNDNFNIERVDLKLGADEHIFVSSIFKEKKQYNVKLSTELENKIMLDSLDFMSKYRIFEIE